MKVNQVKATIFYITNKSHSLAERIKGIYPDTRVLRYQKDIIQQEWESRNLLIFITASGIAVRSISPLVKNKKTDPAVLVIDEQGKHVISLLSGHIGGANSFAVEIADFLKAQPVITTSSDINELTSIDLWARDNNLVIENEKVLPSISTKLINNGYLRVYDETNMKLPNDLINVDEVDAADILITNKLNPYAESKRMLDSSQLILRPKNLVLGLGCNSETTLEEIESVVMDVLRINNISFSCIFCLATIDIKASERGLVAFAKKHGIEMKTYTPDDINKLENIAKSEAAFKATGAFAVAEPCAILASGHGRLKFSKYKQGNVTVAVAEMKKGDNEEIDRLYLQKLQTSKFNKRGKIYIVGTGPGNIKYITPHAIDAIKLSDIIVGYDTYLNLIYELIKDKKIISTGMTQEIERCKKALELAFEGWKVSIISGGDPGIYAMAGLVFELLIAQTSKQVALTPDIEVIPGISALNAAASRLGAPIMHDFASISLSDRLTPWELIAKRLEAAALADFVIILYNPKSKGRSEHINVAASIIQKYRSLDTPVGIVRQAMRDGETVIISTLKDFLSHDIDMQTTIIIGNSNTYIRDGWMVTPRGYRLYEHG